MLKLSMYSAPRRFEPLIRLISLISHDYFDGRFCDEEFLINWTSQITGLPKDQTMRYGDIERTNIKEEYINSEIEVYDLLGIKE